MNKRFLNTVQRSLASLVLLSGYQPAQADITVDAGRILRTKPAEIGGVVINAHSQDFATNSNGIDYQGDLKAAKVHLVRTQSYPDARYPGKNLGWFDTRVRAIQRAGAEPLFILSLRADSEYLKADGTRTGGTPQSNIVSLVKHYMAAPFHLTAQRWEVGNEPDLGIDQHLAPKDYDAQFNACDAALKQAGIRDHVLLCGPVVSHAYHWPHQPAPGETTDIDQFLDDCANSVDLLTYHNYSGSKSPEGVLLAPHKLDNLEDSARVLVRDPKTGRLKDDYGMAALIARMSAVNFGRPRVGIGITEHNTSTFPDSVTRGLWDLAVTHYYLYNPFGMMTTQFVFDDYGNQQGGLGAYLADKKRGPGYWAVWINGNLRGTDVLSVSVDQESTPAPLLVTATSDSGHLYLEIINRTTDPIQQRVHISHFQASGPAATHEFTETKTPDVSSAGPVGLDFQAESAPLSATIYLLPGKKTALDAINFR